MRELEALNPNIIPEEASWENFSNYFSSQISNYWTDSSLSLDIPIPLSSISITY